jgi:hypothetical protein
VKRLAALAIVLASCVAAPTPSPSGPVPAPTAARASATALPSALTSLTKLADGTLVVSIRDCATATQNGGITGCELLDAAADRGVFVGVLRWSDGTFEARSIDLATGEMRTLIPKEDLGIALEDVRDDLAILRETDDLGGGNVHVRLRRVPWRDPSKAETLDEIDLVGLGGGDTWNPWPSARTNGRDVVWLHAGGLFAKHQVIQLDARGAKHIVTESDKPIWFDLDDAGRVPVAVLSSDATTQRFFVSLAGSVQEMGTRAASASGYVMSFGDVVGWARGTGSVRPIDGVELFTDAGRALRIDRPEPGCLFVGHTAKEIVTVCPSGARLEDVHANTVRDGPPSRVVVAYPRALLWRTAADLAANPMIWRITLP